MIYIAFKKCENTPASQHEAGVMLTKEFFSLFDIADEIKKTDNGKPYIDDSRYHISISHTNGIAVCALRCKEEKYDFPDDVFTIFENGEGEIGIDIESFPTDDSLDRFNRIAMRYFGRTFDSAKDFICHWTKSEAFCKYNGSVLTEAFKNDDSERKFFCGTVEFDNKKYLISVCY